MSWTAGMSVSDVTPCPVCGQEAEHDLDCLSGETFTDCLSCGYFASTEILETWRFPMDGNGRIRRGQSNENADRN